MPPLTRAAVVGLGPIGNSWVVAFARAGIRVTAFDLDEARRRALAGECERSFAGLGLAPETSAAALALVGTADGLDEAVRGAAWVQEAASERLDVKQALFAALDRAAAPDAIIASSTSAMPLSSFAPAPPARRERMLIVHPATPPHLLPVVELVPAPFTPDSTITRAGEVMRFIGQSPIVVRKEIRAFVMNRVLAAMFVEMARLVAAGVVTPRDADAAVRDGFALRWAFLGPFEGADLNNPGGIEEYLTKYNSLFEDYAREQGAAAPLFTPELIGAIAADLRRELPLERIAERRHWRDRCITALRRLRTDMGLTNPTYVSRSRAGTDRRSG